MNIESVIVGVIIVTSGIFVSSVAMRKAFAFNKKKACGSDCGCDS